MIYQSYLASNFDNFYQNSKITIYFLSLYFYQFRCFFGSDWPVCRTATGIVDYPDVVKLLEDLLENRSVADRKLIFQDNAITFYGLEEVVEV